MFSLDPFREMSKILESHSNIPLPPAIKELQIKQYFHFFQQMSTQEQRDVEQLRDVAEAATRKIVTMPIETQGELCALAINSLVAIRQKQRACMLFEDLDQSVNKEFFRNALLKFPAECVSLALTVKDRLQSPQKRLRAVQILAELQPEQRTLALESVTNLLSNCQALTHEQLIFGYTRCVEKEERGQFLQHVSDLLSRLDPQYWTNIKDLLDQHDQDLRTSVVREAAALLPPAVAIRIDTLRDLLQQVRMLIPRQEILQGSRPITLHCTDCIYIPQIIREIQNIPNVDERTSVVETFNNILCTSRHNSSEIYEGLRTIMRMPIFARQHAVNYHMSLHQFGGGMHEAPRQDQYVLQLSRTELQQQPIQLLERLVNQINKSIKCSLKVIIDGEPAVDFGGPARDVMRGIVAGSCKLLAKQNSDKLFRPQGLKFSPDERAILHNLGKLFMFCLNSTDGYVFGEEVDSSVFMALTKIQEKHLLMNFDTLDEESFRELFAIYEAMNSIHIDDLKAIQEHAKYLSDPYRREFIAEAMQKELLPCFIIWEGMRAAPFTATTVTSIHGMESFALEERLQGSLIPKKVVDKLEFAPSVPPQQQKWIKEWLLTLDKPKLKKFLYLITGSPGLGKKPLSIEFYGDNVAFSSCSQCLYLPTSCKASKAILHDMLNFALTTEISFNMA